MVKGGDEIPGVDGMGGPGATEAGFFMHQYHGPRGRHHSSIEAVESVKEVRAESFGLRREVWSRLNVMTA